jgi:hypothetical protein
MPRILSFLVEDADEYTQVGVNIESSRYKSFSFLTNEWESDFSRQIGIVFKTDEGYTIDMAFRSTVDGHPSPHIDIKISYEEQVLLVYHRVKCNLQTFSDFVEQFVEEEIISVSSSEEDENGTP